MGAFKKKEITIYKWVFIGRYLYNFSTIASACVAHNE